MVLRVMLFVAGIAVALVGLVLTIGSGLALPLAQEAVVSSGGGDQKQLNQATFGLGLGIAALAIGTATAVAAAVRTARRPGTHPHVGSGLRP